MRKFKYSCICMFIALVTISSTSLPSIAATEESLETKKHVAIVIDDLGNNMAGTEEILNLPIKITVAVMPFLPTTKRDAQLAHEKGHDVLLHLPMQPVKGKSSWLGPGAITTDLSDAEILKRVTEAIDDVPFAVGINNHMGSKATADERIINIILKVCKERGLFFLDSRTTDKSVIGKIAKQLNVPSTENDLFLDDVYTVEHISKQMDKLNKLLKARSTMVAIGHVGPSGKKTAQVIKSSIPAMQQHAQFISISEMLQLRK